MVDNNEKKKYWETVYETKGPDQVSWTQDLPKTSLELITSFGLNKQARIIDIGGGDSRLVDHLHDQGYENISVLDISAKALEKAQNRLGEKAQLVNWIISDIIDFEPDSTFDIWHDRAAFHFLTTADQIEKYLTIASKSVSGYMSIGTFLENGPTKCSGLEIKQYSEKTLTELVEMDFRKIQCSTENHITPFNTTQHFIFCSFQRKTDQ